MIHDCVDASKVRDHDQTVILNRFGLFYQYLILTNIGYFNEQKGQIFLLQSIQNLLKTHPKTTLIIVNWKPLENQLKQLTEKLGIRSSVLFTGKLNQEQVFEILSITDIFVLSSL